MTGAASPRVAAPAGFWRLETYESLPSTSDAVIARAVAGEPDGLAILARQQTAPRATRGRVWHEPEGNLALSVLVRPEHSPRPGDYALLAGVALRAALGSFLTDQTALSLKWPNDVLLSGRKLGGILIDSVRGDRAAGPDWLVLGFGANLAAAPAVDGRTTACLAEMIVAPAPEDVAGRLLAELEQALSCNPDEVRAAWLDAAHPIGTSLQAGSVHGAFAGLDDTGALCLQTADGIRTITAGEVLLGR